MRLMMFLSLATMGVSMAATANADTGPFCRAHKCECTDYYCARLDTELSDDQGGVAIRVYTLTGGDPALNGVSVHVEISGKDVGPQHWDLGVDVRDVTEVRLVKSGLVLVGLEQDDTSENRVRSKKLQAIVHYSTFDGQTDMTWKVTDKPGTQPQRAGQAQVVPSSPEKEADVVYIDQIRTASDDPSVKTQLDALAMVILRDVKRLISMAELSVVDQSNEQGVLPPEIVLEVNKCAGLPCIANALKPHGFSRVVGGRLSEEQGSFGLTLVGMPGADGRLVSTQSCKSEGSALDLLRCVPSAVAGLGFSDESSSDPEQPSELVPKVVREPPKQKVQEDFLKLQDGSVPHGWIAPAGTYVRTGSGQKALVSTPGTILVPMEFVPDNFTLEFDVKFGKTCCGAFVVWIGNLSFGVHSNGESWLGESKFRLSKLQKYRQDISFKNRLTIKLFKKGPVFQLSVGGVGAAMIRKEDFKPGRWITVNSGLAYAMYWLKLLPFAVEVEGTDVRPDGVRVFHEDFAEIEEGHPPPGWEGCKTLAVTKSNWFGGGNALANFQNGNHYLRIKKLHLGKKVTARFLLRNRDSCCEVMKFEVDGHYFGLHTNGDSYLGSKKFRLPGDLPFEKDYAVVEYEKDGELGKLYLNGVYLGMARQSRPPTGDVAFSYEDPVSVGSIEVWSSPRQKAQSKGAQKKDVNLTTAAWKDRNVAIVVGKGGVALRTQDGGKSWTGLSIGTANDLVGIGFRSTGAIEVTSAKRVWLSSDDGKTWAERDRGDVAWLSDVLGLKANGKQLLRTTDGGNSWKQVWRFAKSVVGFAAGSPTFWVVAVVKTPHRECEDAEISVYATLNGGGTWKRLNTLGVRSLNSTVDLYACGEGGEQLCVGWEPGICCSDCYCGCDHKLVKLTGELDFWEIAGLSTAPLVFGGDKTACFVDSGVVRCTNKKATDALDFKKVVLPDNVRADEILDLALVAPSELRLITKRGRSHGIFASSDLGLSWGRIGDIP